MNQDVREATSRLEKTYPIEDIEQYVILEYVKLEKEDNYSYSKLFSRAQDVVRNATGKQNGIYINRFVWDCLSVLKEHGYTDVVPDVDELKEILNKYVTEYQRQAMVQALQCLRPFSDDLF